MHLQKRQTLWSWSRAIQWVPVPASWLWLCCFQAALRWSYFVGIQDLPLHQKRNNIVDNKLFTFCEPTKHVYRNIQKYMTFYSDRKPLTVKVKLQKFWFPDVSVPLYITPETRLVKRLTFDGLGKYHAVNPIVYHEIILFLTYNNDFKGAGQNQTGRKPLMVRHPLWTNTKYISRLSSRCEVCLVPSG